MFNYDEKKSIATITTAPLEFYIIDLVVNIQMTLDELLETHQCDCVANMDTDDYRKLCNLVFEKAKYKENKA